MKMYMVMLFIFLVKVCSGMEHVSKQVSFFDLLDYGTAEEIASAWRKQFCNVTPIQRYLLLVSLKPKFNKLFERYNDDEHAMMIFKETFSSLWIESREVLPHIFAPHADDISLDDEESSNSESSESYVHADDNNELSESQNDDVHYIPVVATPVPRDNEDDEQGFIFTLYHAHKRVILNIIIGFSAGIGGARNIYLNYYAWQTKDKAIAIDATVPAWLSDYAINITPAERRVSCGLHELTDSGVLYVLKKMC